MSVRIKLLVIVLFAALVPLSVSAYTALGVHRSAFDEKVEQQQRNAAFYASVIAEARLDDVRRSLRSLASPIRWPQLSEEEQQGALSLVYAQLDDIAVVQLLDSEGEGIGPAVRLSERGADPDFAAHPPVSLETMERFSEHIPFDHTNENSVLVGTVFSAADSDTPLVGLSVRVIGANKGTHWYVAVGMSLAGLCDQVRGAPSAALTISVVDGSGRGICPPPGRKLLDAVASEVAAASSGQQVNLVSFVGHDGTALRGAVAAMPTGWMVVAQQPVTVATAASREMVKRTVFWIGISVLVALVAGLFLAQGIIAPVRKLTTGADELARGNLSHRLDVTGRDELAELAAQFNKMSTEIEARNEEIQAWNVELKDRVDERTRELKQAQKQLLQSQKIAAVSSLAAGVAHEINNPLTGVLGLTQVLKLQAGDAKKAELLGTIETEAKRIRDIVQTLLTFSQESSGEGLAELEVKGLAEGAADLIRSKFDQAGVRLVLEHAEGVPLVRGNDAQLRQAVLHLLSNALGATDRDGVVTLQTRSVEGKVAKLVVVDTGRGIPPENLDRIFEPFFTTKEDWGGQGLGLTVAYRVVEEHGGSIEVKSEVGKGTTVEVTLPAVAGGAHLV